MAPETPKAELAGSKWAKTLSADFGSELVRRWDMHEKLRALLNELARSADTAELLLRKDYPGQAASLREHVKKALWVLNEVG